MRYAVVPVVLVAVAVAVGGVAAMAPAAPEVPRTTGAIHAWDTGETDRPLVTAIRFENPNRFPVVVTAVHYDVRAGDTVVGEGLSAPRVVVPAGGSGLLVVRTTPQDAALEHGDPSTYTVEGIALVTALGVPVPVPFSHGPGDGGGAPIPGLDPPYDDASHKNA